MAEPKDKIPPTLPLEPAPGDAPRERVAEPPPTQALPASTSDDQPTIRKEAPPQPPDPQRTEALAPKAPAPPPDHTAVLADVNTDAHATRADPRVLMPPIPETIAQWKADANEVPSVAGQAVPGYEILSELGRGGMGVVYKARQVGLNRVVALKMVLSGSHASKQELARFRAEGEAVARLQHPNIVQIYEVGTHDGRPYFSLEFVNGGSLADQLQGDPLEPRRAVELTEMLAQAMHYAHEQGIVHRDLKPANVLLSAERGDGGSVRGLSARHESGSRSRSDAATHPGTRLIPKITDFGLAKDVKHNTGQTQEGSVLGTPSYMAPEQAAGKIEQIGPRADVYALGAIFYELLTGRPPFDGDNAWDIVKQVINEEPLPPAQLRRGLPRDLETICLKCLHKEPQRRYASAAELADDLGRWLNDQPINARPVSDWEKMAKWVRRNPGIAALSSALAVAFLIIVVGGFLLLKRSRDAAVAELVVVKEDKNEAIRRKDDAVELALQSRLEAYAAQLNLAQTALLEAQIGRVNELLSSLVPSADQKDLRGFEWYYLRQLSRSSLTLKGHTNLVSNLVFSPDGKRMTTASLDGGVKVWDPKTGEPVLDLKNGHKGPVRCVAYSRDGKTLATGGEDGAVILWDVERGIKLRTITRHSGFVTALAFSPDGGKLVTGSEDRTALVWDLGTAERPALKEPLLTLHGHRYGLTSVAFSPDGRSIATASWDRTARVWNSTTGSERYTLPQHGHWVRGVAFSPDGKRLATASWDRVVRLFDAETGTPQRTLRDLPSPPQSLVFSPDGQKLVTLGVDLKARLWDLNMSEDASHAVGTNGPVRGIAFSPDGELLASVRFDYTGKAAEGERPLTEHQSSVHAVAFRPSKGAVEQLASAGADNVVQLWKLETREVSNTLKGHEGPVRALAYSRDGKLLASGGEDGTARLWDPATGQALRGFDGHKAWVTSLSFNPEGTRLATACEDGVVRVWNLDDPSAGAVPTLALSGHTEGARAVAWQPEGGQLATTAGDGTVRLWEAKTGKELRTLVAPVTGERRGQVRALAYSPDGRLLATAGWDGQIVLWEAATGTLKRTLSGHTYGVTAVAFNADGTRLASSSEDRTVKVWDMTTGRELLSLVGHGAGVTGVAFSADGAFLASSCWDEKVRLWAAPRKE